ncbi:hypothetical protein [Vibrio nigripulchritudo]|uniref:hypothetical protein n=1 Tax=Vibrio nigripulchritudo TaxID=28173 RepID=UPI0003B1BA31|nr:hypothetical protein [Vibrio nigripulchritudo]CCN69766.1 conserved hypothetical protein [Vibrio nigripulchritudo SFn118]
MGRNWAWSRQRGVESRLKAEECAAFHGEPLPSRPPLHSHDATMQSYFEKGWRSVPQHTIDVHLCKIKAVPTDASPLAKLRSIRKCHF